MADNRWLSEDVPRGEDYDQRFVRLAASGQDVHGEADLVASYEPSSVLDAGCGTGRVAIELARRGIEVVGVDADPAMLEVAQQKAPQLTWAMVDLADRRFDLGRHFDAIVLAGNVMIFLAPGSEEAVVANLAAHLDPGGRMIAGYSLQPGGLSVATHDRLAAAHGLALEARFATWDRVPFAPHALYTVSVHQRVA
ncbi:MAG TPA: class I SAM-dependent methyltransferase [Acidimicrobiales bacterium]